MEIRNAATFVKVVEYNNFTKAAESLGYSQAAVTAQIKALESELGVPLFDRIGRGISLTQEGREFLPYAINLLNAEEEARNSVRQPGELTGDLKICSASSYAMGPLPDILLKFMRENPGVNVTLKVSDYLEDTIPRLNRGEIDFLVCMDEENAFPQFTNINAKEEPIIFVTYPNNPLAKKKKLKAAEVIGDRFLTPDRDIGYCAMLERELRSRGIEMGKTIEIGSVGAIIRMLLDGYGTSFIPEYTAAEYLQSGELVRLNVSDIKIKLCSYFLCSRERWINPVMKAFIKTITA